MASNVVLPAVTTLLNQLSVGILPDQGWVLPNCESTLETSALEAALRAVVHRQQELEKQVAAGPLKRPSPLFTPPTEVSQIDTFPQAPSPRSSPSLSQLTFSDGSTQIVTRSVDGQSIESVSSGVKHTLIGCEAADNIGLLGQVALLKEQLSKSENDRVNMAQTNGAVISALEKELAKSQQDIEDFLEALRKISEVTKSVAKGDLSQKINIQAKGIEILELKSTINSMVDRLRSFASEVTRVAREVGTEGSLGGQAELPDVEGTWLELTASVNEMASNLTTQVRSIAEVTTAVAQGDLSKQVEVDAQGEMLQLKDTINSMVHRLRDFADQVSRVAREVGTEGRLGGQAQIKGVSGCWRELCDNVNTMASNLTTQVRSIAEVTTAVARGDLTKQVEVDAQGEIKDLKITINSMVSSLVNFSSEVTRVSREVGTEGILGGQAQVENAEGTWRVLVGNVNKMAANLTAQVRSIAHVTTAVAMGDLSTKIEVPAQGEILELKNTINEMYANYANLPLK